MFKPGRRNPSFFVATLDTADPAPAVERDIAKRLATSPAPPDMLRQSCPETIQDKC